MMCNNMLVKIWGATLFSSLWLLFMCIVFAPPNTTFRDSLLYLGPIGGGLFVLSIAVACWYKPLNRALFDDPPSRYQSQNSGTIQESLNNNPQIAEAFYQRTIVPVVRIEPVVKEDIIYVAEQVNIDTIVVAEQINQV